MHFIIFVIIVVAIYFGIRTASHFVDSGVLPSSFVRITTGTILFSGIVVASLSRSSSIPILVWATGAALLSTITSAGTIKRRRHLFEVESIVWIRKTILHMQTGSAFREAAIRGLEGVSKHNKLKFQDLLEAVVFSQQIASSKVENFVQALYFALARADFYPHLGIDILREFELSLLLKQKFRRRSIQVTRQLKLQSAILSLFYTAAFILVVSHYGIQEHQNLLVVSIVLFAVGTVMIYLSGSKKSWKI